MFLIKGVLCVVYMSVQELTITTTVDVLYPSLITSYSLH